MIRLLLIPALALSLPACANFQAKAGNSLAAVQAALVSARETLLPVVDAMCRSAAERCADMEDMECPALVKCDEFRGKVIDTLVGAHFAVLNGNTAVALGQEKDAWSAIDKALALVRQLREHMKQLGIGD